MPRDICCIHCGESCLTHTSVEVFVRAEDANEGMLVIIEKCDDPDGNAVLRSDRTLFGNPSSRRGGIRIKFHCSNCRGGTMVLISQHKGESFHEFLPAD